MEKKQYLWPAVSCSVCRRIIVHYFLRSHVVNNNERFLFFHYYRCFYRERWYFVCNDCILCCCIVYFTRKKITVFGNKRMMGYRLKVHGRATQWIFFHLKEEKKLNLYYINPVRHKLQSTSKYVSKKWHRISETERISVAHGELKKKSLVQ